MITRFNPWEASRHLRDEEDMRLYFEACSEKDPGDGSLIRAALLDIAKARNMTELAHRAGVSR